MKESLMVFEQICNSKWFSRTSMILFLNKIDLFQTKLRYSSLTSYFPDFKGFSTINIHLTNIRRRKRLPSSLPLFSAEIHTTKQKYRKRSLRSFYQRNR